MITKRLTVRFDQIKSSSRSIGILFLLGTLGTTIGCQKAEPHNGNANTAPATTAASPASTAPSTTIESKATPETPPTTTNISLATPTDTYKTGYAARQNKDVATLKRVFSKDALAFFTDVGAAEKKTLDDQLKELAEKPQGSSAETRNEKINGNRASLEYLTEKATWATMDFTKEGNEWKIDLPKAP